MSVHLYPIARVYTLVVSTLLVAIGVLGFSRRLRTPFTEIELAALTLPSHAGYLLGVFPVNGLDNIHYIAIGVLGFTAFTADLFDVRPFCRGITVWYGLLGLLGFFPYANALLIGIMPVWGWDIALHFILATSALFMGFWPFWVPNEAYDEGDADQSGRPGVPKRPARTLTAHDPGLLGPRPATTLRSAGRPPSNPPALGDAGPTYRPPRFDSQGNPIR